MLGMNQPKKKESLQFGSFSPGLSSSIASILLPQNTLFDGRCVQQQRPGWKMKPLITRLHWTKLKVSVVTKKHEDWRTQQDLSPLKQTADRWEDAVFFTKEFGSCIAVCSVQEKVSPESKLGLCEPLIFLPLLLPTAFLSYLSQGILLLFSSLDRPIKGFPFPIQAEWLLETGVCRRRKGWGTLGCGDRHFPRDVFKPLWMGSLFIRTVP